MNDDKTKAYPDIEEQSDVVAESAMHAIDANSLKLRGMEMLMGINDTHTLQLVVEDMSFLLEDKSYAERLAKVDAYCKGYLPEDLYKSMKDRNFLINQPRPTNDEEFADLDKLFAEIEAEGDCTEEEVSRMMAV